ncbi:MAG: hypothetical protein ACREAA_01890 [Candidatus Polarisedimenticolia bacterium]
MRRHVVILLTHVFFVTPLLAVQTDHYTLRKDGSFESGCFAPCMCPILLQAPVRGGFRLVFDRSDGLFDHYRVENVRWTVRLGADDLPVTGSGTYRIGGELARQHQLALDLQVGTEPVQHFDSGLVVPPTPFPRIDARISINEEYCHDSVFDVHARRVRNMDVDGAALRWEALPAVEGHDIVRGSLQALHATSGDYATSVQECVAANVTGDWLTFAPDPPPGEGYWFLLRDREDGISGSYDSGEADQVGSADVMLEGSPLACP